MGIGEVPLDPWGGCPGGDRGGTTRSLGRGVLVGIGEVPLDPWGGVSWRGWGRYH